MRRSQKGLRIGQYGQRVPLGRAVRRSSVPTSRRGFLIGAAVAGLGAEALAACTDASAPPSAASGDATTPAVSTPAASSSPPVAASTDAASIDRTDLVHGPRTSAGVALTFHGAGDPALTRRVLAEARSAGARLTVLAVGTWLDTNPTLARAILDAGHELGNHTWAHLPMRSLSPAKARSEVERGAEVLERLTGSRGRWFRPSGTPTSTATIRAAAVAAGYQRCLGYDVDPRDYQDPGSAVVVARLEQQVRAGSIVSLHLGHSGTVAALPRIFDVLHRKDLRAVTVSGLVGA
jgi:peptidoglycan/xylan/chitin deacetylase (PgdA/CDA1 family)